MFLSRWLQKLSRKLSPRERRKNSKTRSTALPRLEILEDRLTPAVLYWDPNGTVAGIGGAGTWGTSALQWNTAADGSGSLVQWNNANNDTAVFAGTGGIVTLDAGVTAAGITANGLEFNTSDYSIANNTLTLAGSTPTISAASGVSATISSAVAGTAGLTKTGAGVLILTNNNSYSGNTFVDEGMLQVGNNSVGIAHINSSTTVKIDSDATFRFFRGDTTQLTLSHTFTGAGAIRLSGAGTANVASQWFTSQNNSDFTGRWVLDGARLHVGSQNALGASSTVEVEANGQLLLSGNVTYANNIIVTDSSGWRDAGFRLGAIRMENNSNISGNITLNQTTGVINDDGTGLGAVISGYSAGTHILSGVISGSGEFSMSRFTAGSAGTSKVDFILSGSSSNTYTGRTVVDGQHGGASLWLSKTGSAKAIAADTVVQFGSNTGGASNLRMGGNDQFGAGVVMNFSGTGGHHRFDLKGTTQTLAGVNAGALVTRANAVIQNQGIDAVVPAGNATLILNGAGNYTYNGWLRDQDNSGTNFKLNLVKDGSGTQTFAALVTGITGSTTIDEGTLRLYNSGFSPATSAVAINDGGKLHIDGTVNLSYANQLAIALNQGGTLQNSNTGYTTLGTGTGGSVTNSGATTIIQSSPATGEFGRGLFLDGGFKGTGTVTINAQNAGSGVNFRNNNTSFAGKMIVNGIASTTAFAGSGIGVGGSTTGLQNADIELNGTMELLSQGIGWANTASGAFKMGALSGSGVMVGNFTSGGITTVTLGNTNNDGSFSGVIANGTGNIVHLTKIGAGTQTLTGANIYSGTTTISGGTLQIGNGGDTGVLGSGNVVDNASLIFNRGNTITVDNAISGTGSLTKRGAGTLILTNGGSTYSGGTILSQGAIDASIINGLGGSGVAAARDLTFGDALTAGGNLRLRVNGNFSLRDIIVSADATGANTLEISTAGGATFNINSISLANALTFSLTAGALEDIQFHATTNVITGGTAPGTDAFIFHSAMGQTLRTSLANGMAPGAIDFTGNVRVTGNATWQMQNRTYLGNTPGNQNLWIPDTSSVTVDANATWAFTWGDETIAGLNGGGKVLAHPSTGAHTLTVGGDDANGNFSGAINNGAITSLTKIGAGTQILGGSNNYSGVTTVNGGVLQVDGSIANSAVTVNNSGVLAGTGATGAVTVQSGGDLAPGASIGSINTGNLHLAAGSDYKVEVGAGAADRTNVTGSVTLAGNLVTSGTPPQNNGAALVIINNDGNDAVNGTFANLAEGATVTVGLVSYFITYKYNAVTNTLGSGNDVALIDNTPPTANNDTYAVTEDTPFSVVAPGVLVNDTDPQAPPQTLMVSRVQGSVGGPVAVTAGGVTVSTTKGSLLIKADGSFTYTPNADLNGIDNITLYWATDGIEESFSATVTFNIAEVNDGPDAVDDVNATTELGTIIGGVLANDSAYESGQTLTVTNPGTYTGLYGTMTLNVDGSYSYTANANQLTAGQVVTDSFTYTITDDGTTSSNPDPKTDTATLTITITGENDAPTANDDGSATTELGTTTGNVLSNDTDPDDGETGTLVVNAPGTYVGAYGTLTLNSDGSYSYTASANQLTAGQVVTDSFTYQTRDVQNASSGAATLTITITGENDGPTANGDGSATTELGTTTGNVLSNDTDPDDGETGTLVVNAPGTYVGAYGTLTLNSDGSYSYTASANQLTAGQVVTDSFTYQTRDVQNDTSSPATLTITITGQNDAPTANDESFSVAANGSYSGNVLGNDTDPDTGTTLTVTSVTLGSTTTVVPTSGSITVTTEHGTLTISANGAFTYTPGIICDADSDSFTYTIGDGASGIDTGTVNITITYPTGVSVSDGVMLVGGGGSADTVTVSGGNLIFNGTSYSLAGVSEVRIWTRGGNDSVDLSGLTLKAFVHGGSGDDVITGGSGDDVLLGGFGNDTITGASGNDLLVGGDGVDRLVGSSGNDVLVAGDVDCELTLEDLCALLADWVGGGTASTSTTDDALEGAVVDTASDMLTGGSGADLFIISLGDKITDLGKYKNINANGTYGEDVVRIV